MAVYTEVGDDDLAKFLDDYRLGQLVGAKGIAEGVENTNYLIETERVPYFLTLYEKRVKEEDLPYFLGLMVHLNERGIASPHPVACGEGRLLRRLCGRPAALFTFLQGLSPRRVKTWHCTALGTALAKMHLATRDYSGWRANDLSIGGWPPLIAATRQRADEVAQGLGKEITRSYESLVGRWPRALPAGVIHADLFPDNVFFLGEELSGLIDFYFACNDFYAYDLAVCLNAWCFDQDGSFDIEKGRRLLLSYDAARPLTEDEWKALPILAQGAALRFLLTRLYDWLNHPPGAFVEPKDPKEYLTRLRFHRHARGPASYGIF